MNMFRRIKIAKKLKDLYKSERQDLRNISISKVCPLSDKASHEMYSFKLKYSDGVRRYSEESVIRMYPNQEDSINMCQREFKIMKCLTNTDIPVPFPHFMQLDSKLFGVPFLIMEKKYGKNLLEESNSCSQQEFLSYLEKYVKLLVDLHSLDFKKAGLDFIAFSNPPYGYADICLGEIKQMVETVNSEYIKDVYDWLVNQRNNVACRHYVFIHGNYKPNKVIVKDGKIVALIDWEKARIADPVSELGWASFWLKILGEYSIWDGNEIREFFLQKYQDLTHISLRNLSFYEIRAALTFRLFLSLLGKYETIGIDISQDDEMFFSETYLLDMVDNFIEERMANQSKF